MFKSQPGPDKYNFKAVDFSEEDHCLKIVFVLSRLVSNVVYTCTLQTFNLF